MENIMMIWFECRKDRLMIGLETDTKPTVGDTILVEGKEYDVKKVIWCLEKAPAQSGIKVEIESHMTQY